MPGTAAPTVTQAPPPPPQYREEALRARLQAFFASNPSSLPLAILRLQRYDFGWSVFAGSRIIASGIDSAIDGAALNEVALPAAGLAELADILGGGDAATFALSCAAPMSRPMVREEAFRSLFAWLQRCESDAEAFVVEHYASLEQLILAALTDTWSAVRKASARALDRAAMPMRLSHLRRLHASVLALRIRLQTGSGSAGSASGGVVSDQNAWKAHEGLLLGTAALLRFVGRLQVSGAGLVVTAEPSAIASFEEDHAPEALLRRMRTEIRPTIFAMLAHPQIAVRETAQDTFLATLPLAQPRCTDEGGATADAAANAAACGAFAELIARLGTATSALGTADSDTSYQTAPPSTSGSYVATTPVPGEVGEAVQDSRESQLRSSLPQQMRSSLRINCTLLDAASASPSSSTPPHAHTAHGEQPAFLCLHPAASVSAQQFALDEGHIDATACNGLHHTTALVHQPAERLASYAAARGGDAASAPPDRALSDNRNAGAVGGPLLPAFEAEGLLGLAVALIPRLPPVFMLRNCLQGWDVSF